MEWQELALVRQFEPDGDKEGAPACVACVADSRSKVEQDPLIPVTTHSLPKQTFGSNPSHSEGNKFDARWRKSPSRRLRETRIRISPMYSCSTFIGNFALQSKN